LGVPLPRHARPLRVIEWIRTVSKVARQMCLAARFAWLIAQ
jgi:hypothetical protein